MTTGGSTDLRETLVAQAHEAGRFPGIVAVTSRNGDVDWRCERGETGTAYRVASITKTFTAVAVLQLRDEGRIDLDDAIGTHLPDAPYGSHTIRRLLAHSSGMTAEPTGPWWERVPGGSWDDLVAANTPPQNVFGPGQRHHYSNLGYGLLGELVARLRDRSWWQAITEQILQPVGLMATTYHPPAGAAVGTSRDPLTGRLMREPSEDERAMAPAGQIWSTVDDLARWADLLAAGHDGVLRARTAVEMRTIQSGDPETQHRGGYGLGLRLHWAESTTLVGHTGSLPGFLAGMFVDPVSRTGAVVLANATHGLDPEETCAALIAAATAPEQPTRPDGGPVADPAAASADLAGPWYWGNTPMELVPTADGFTLVAAASRTRFSPERGSPGDAYRGENGYLAGELLAVHRGHDGRARYLEVATFVYTRTPYDPVAPIPGDPPLPL